MREQRDPGQPSLSGRGPGAMMPSLSSLGKSTQHRHCRRLSTFRSGGDSGSANPTQLGPQLGTPTAYSTSTRVLEIDDQADKASVVFATSGPDRVGSDEANRCSREVEDCFGRDINGKHVDPPTLAITAWRWFAQLIPTLSRHSQSQQSETLSIFPASSTSRIA